MVSSFFTILSCWSLFVIFQGIFSGILIFKNFSFPKALIYFFCCLFGILFGGYVFFQSWRWGPGSSTSIISFTLIHSYLIATSQIFHRQYINNIGYRNFWNIYLFACLVSFPTIVGVVSKEISLSLIISLIISFYLTRNSKKGDLIQAISILFVDCDFKKFILIDFISWIYFFAMLIFWTFNINMILFGVLYPPFFKVIGLIVSIGLLVFIRVSLEAFISIIRISENTSPKELEAK